MTVMNNYFFKWYYYYLMGNDKLNGERIFSSVHGGIKVKKKTIIFFIRAIRFIRVIRDYSN